MLAIPLSIWKKINKQRDIIILITGGYTDRW